MQTPATPECHVVDVWFHLQEQCRRFLKGLRISVLQMTK